MMAPQLTHLTAPMFFGPTVQIARYDQVKYPQIDKLTEKQIGFFWRPEEVDVTKDKADFAKLSDHEKHIFTSNLKRQIVLDTFQGRSPTETMLPIASIPEIEPWIQTWAFFETIHSRSYTHIIRNVYPNPSEVFDTMLDIPEITSCAKSISVYYDDYMEYLNYYKILGEGKFKIYSEISKTTKKLHITLKRLKKKFWLCLNSINILEGIRFYVSFACSWAFGQLGTMEGNSKIIKFIARDENVHLAGSQTFLKLLVKEDPEFAEIQELYRPKVRRMFIEAVNQEKEWAKYLFKDGSMIGLNESMLCDYIEWIATRRMKVLGYGPEWNVSQANPLPWTEQYIGGSNVQVAPQETQVENYIIGGVAQDVTLDTFKGMSL